MKPSKYRRINTHGIALSAGPTFLAQVDELCAKRRTTRASTLEYALYKLGQEYGVEIGPRFVDNDKPDPDPTEE